MLRDLAATKCSKAARSRAARYRCAGAGDGRLVGGFLGTSEHTVGHGDQPNHGARPGTRRGGGGCAVGAQVGVKKKLTTKSKKAKRISEFVFVSFVFFVVDFRLL